MKDSKILEAAKDVAENAACKHECIEIPAPDGWIKIECQKCKWYYWERAVAR